MALPPPFAPGRLPTGIRSRFVDGVNGLRMHVLEAGFEDANRPCVLLLHGFPELAYTWRKVMVPLARAGFHVIAPDQRGYGRTTGCDTDFDGELRAFRMANLVKDAVALVHAFGYREVHALVGHDFGSVVAGWAGIVRPDVFRSIALMSAPFPGVPALPFGTAGGERAAVDDPTRIHSELAAQQPPRKHYAWYYSTRGADRDMRYAPQGIHAFLRAYFHSKSADCAGNEPFALAGWRGDEAAKMPSYYIMRLDEDMAQTVAPFMPDAAQVTACRWLPEDELAVYSSEFERTGFQGGLQWYRCETGGTNSSDFQLFAGRTIDVPSCFIAGRHDWGYRQRPGAFEAMQDRACTQLAGCHLVEGAGHWVQQERPNEVTRLLLQFLQ
jgi:pimeloyl-ACP methyl ester carboxylesterase